MIFKPPITHRTDGAHLAYVDQIQRKLSSELKPRQRTFTLNACRNCKSDQANPSDLDQKPLGRFPRPH